MNTLPEHIRYKKITQNSEHFFFLKSNSLNDDIAFIQYNKIKNVCLSENNEYDLLNVLPIVHIDCIQNLRIYVKKIDLKGLDKLTSLEELSIGEEYQNLELSNLSNLHTIYLVNGKFTGLQSLLKLKDLTIVYGNANALSANNFAENSSIESLSIYNAKGQIDFSFLQKLNNLKEIDLYNIKTIIDMRLFNSYAEKLESLRIEKCKELRNLEKCLGSFFSLKYLSLIDSVPITSALNLSQLKSIEVVVIVGTSYIIDGDLSQLTNLRHVSIDNKQHYSLKNEQLPKLPYE